MPSSRTRSLDCSREHRAALTGQQFQSPDNEPYYVLFEDFTHVKFYRRSLFDACVLDGYRFDGFQHVDDWVPQRLARPPVRTPCRVSETVPAVSRLLDLTGRVALVTRASGLRRVPPAIDER